MEDELEFEKDFDYDFDFESGELSKEEIERNESNLRTLEKKINQWKLEKLYEQTNSNQNVAILKQYKREVADLYAFLKQCIDTDFERCAIPEYPEMAELIDLMKGLGEIDVPTRVQILHVLKRDLLEFPFTYSSAHLRTLSKNENISNDKIDD